MLMRVHLHGRFLDEEKPRDLAVREASYEQLVDLALTWRQESLEHRHPIDRNANRAGKVPVTRACDERHRNRSR